MVRIIFQMALTTPVIGRITLGNKFIIKLLPKCIKYILNNIRCGHGILNYTNGDKVFRYFFLFNFKYFSYSLIRKCSTKETGITICKKNEFKI